MLKTQTNGTWLVIAGNCLLALVGVLQGVDWVTLVGNSNAGWAMAGLAAINALAHYFTGPNALSSK
jgi:hypothetical protein